MWGQCHIVEHKGCTARDRKGTARDTDPAPEKQQSEVGFIGDLFDPPHLPFILYSTIPTQTKRQLASSKGGHGACVIQTKLV
mmetsp:Transcript_10620/g.18658  ORF Transcript_10620/g.18658 Transcript_10620/m.18658 type:complete len:82 (-) Transcript_10620:491-736(-)